MFAYKEDGNYYYYSLIPNSELLSIKKYIQTESYYTFEES